MKKIILLIICISNIALSQNNNISQAELDSIIIYPVTTKKLDSFKMLLKTSTKLKGWTYYYNSVAIQKYHSQEYDSAIYYQKKAIDYFQNSKVKRDFDEKKLTQAYYYIGKSFVKKKQYNSAITNLQKAINLSKKHHYKWHSFIIAAIAECHLKLGDNRVALKYYKQVLKDSLYRTLDRPNITTNTRIGAIYLSEYKNLDSAKFYSKKALKKSLDSDFKKNISWLHKLLSDIYRQEKKIDSTIYHLKKFKYNYDKYNINNSYDNLFLLAGYSYVQIQEEKYNEAYKNLRFVYDSIKKMKKVTKVDKQLGIDVFDNFILGHTKNGDYKKALKKYEEKINFLELFYERLLKEKISDLEIQFHSKEKDKSILQLEQSKQQQETIIKQQKAISYGLGGFLMILSGFGYLFWRQRKFKNQYEKVNLEQRLLRSQMNPHFIFNTLNIINSLATKKSEKTNIYILKFSNLLRLTLNNSREEFVSLADETSALEDYLALQSDFYNKFKYTIQIGKHLENKDLYIPPMLIQPFVENSIEHGNLDKNGRIEIEFTSVKNKKLIKCNIVDNGIGYSNSQENNENIIKLHKSISGSIVKERLNIYKKKFRVNSDFNITDNLDNSNKIIGTKVEILIPYIID